MHSASRRPAVSSPLSTRFPLKQDSSRAAAAIAAVTEGVHRGQFRHCSRQREGKGRLIAWCGNRFGPRLRDIPSAPRAKPPAQLAHPARQVSHLPALLLPLTGNWVRFVNRACCDWGEGKERERGRSGSVRQSVSQSGGLQIDFLPSIL